MQLLVSLPYL